MKNAEKKGHLNKSSQHNCVHKQCVFLFCVSLNFVFFAENTIKIGVSAKKKTKKKQKKTKKNNKFYMLKTGPSIS